MQNSIQDLSFTFPAIQGIQAGRSYYVAMVRLSHLVRLIDLDRRDVPPELRAQRTINKGRVPGMRRYLLENRTSYVLSSITISVGGEVRFESLAEGSVGRRLGMLTVPADAPIVINDGQHRRAAIEQALQEAPELGRETVSVVLFVDAELKRSQQRFADLNRYTIRPTRSISILYDHRDELSCLVADVVEAVPAFATTTEKVKTTISNRSRKLFTLSSLYHATKTLISHGAEGHVDQKRLLAIAFWTAVADQFVAWQQVAAGDLHPADLRATYVHAHGVALHAIGIAGCDLLYHAPSRWQDRVKKIAGIDWRRSNTALWEGRALRDGRVSKAHSSIALTADVIRQHLEVPKAAHSDQVQEQAR